MRKEEISEEIIEEISNDFNKYLFKFVFEQKELEKFKRRENKMTRKERKEELENYKSLAENYLKKLLEEKNAREELQKKYDELKNKIETTPLIEPKVMLNKIDYASDVNENIESLETQLINICKKFYCESAFTKPFVYRNYPIESECLSYEEWLNEFNK